MKTHNPLFAKIAKFAKQNVKEIDVFQAKVQLSETNPPVLVDVRETSEWQNGYLPNAIHLSKGVIERDIEKVIPDLQTPIILYCGGGFRSALAAKNLHEMGYTNVISMDGGFRGWCDAGYPVVKDKEE